MICDYVGLSVPETVASGVLAEVSLVLNAISCMQVNDLLWREPSGGTFRYEARRGFSTFGASGAMLGALRERGLYNDFFLPFVGTPHRVTRLDIAHDVFRPSPPILRRLYGAASSGDIGLTRKRLNSSQVTKMLSRGFDGVDTGTVYLGRRTAEVRAKVYDKAHERWQKEGIEPTGPVTRYELTITSKSGAALGDVFSPTSAFWHFMGDVLRRPSGIDLWTPSNDDYAIPKRASLLPYEVLSRKVSDSTEIGNLIALAAECGPQGLEAMIRKIRERAAQAGTHGLAATGS